MWTHFCDMNSGGGTKEEPYDHIYIEAPRDEARLIFYNRFGHDPERISCTCCGEDYSIVEQKSLRQLTGFHRGCRYLETPRGKDGSYTRPKDPQFEDHYYLEEGEDPPKGYKLDGSFPKMRKYMTLEKYLKQKNVLVIYEQDIKQHERVGEIPESGWVYKD